MDCRQAEKMIGAEPGAVDPALKAHLRTCAACSGYHGEMRRLEAGIRGALELPLAPMAGRAQPSGSSRRWAIAASVLLAFGAGLALWTLRPGELAARDLIAHVNEEPTSWTARDLRSPAEVGAVLERSDLPPAMDLGEIVYAHSCIFRGREVPHLVMRTASGPVTVIILRHESVTTRRNFSESGYTGVIVPARQGALAVLARESAQVEAVAARVLAALDRS